MDSSTTWLTDTCASWQDPSGGWGASVCVCVRVWLGCAAGVLLEEV